MVIKAGHECSQTQTGPCLSGLSSETRPVSSVLLLSTIVLSRRQSRRFQEKDPSGSLLGETKSHTPVHTNNLSEPVSTKPWACGFHNIRERRFHCTSASGPGGVESRQQQPQTVLEPSSVFVSWRTTAAAAEGELFASTGFYLSQHTRLHQLCWSVVHVVKRKVTVGQRKQSVDSCFCLLLRQIQHIQFLQEAFQRLLSSNYK